MRHNRPVIFRLNEADERKFGELLSVFDANVRASEALNEKMKEADRSLLKEARVLRPEAYRLDPYSESVKPARRKFGSWELTYERYRPRQVFLSDAVASLGAPFYAEKNPLGYFPRPYEYLCLKERGRTWMSVIPHEINTMRAPLSRMKGRVVAMGLGLGYFAFRCLLKKEVSHLTVVEKDPRLIRVFRESLAPFFPNLGKLRLVEGNAFDEATVGPLLEEADSVFYDTWHDEDDGLAMLGEAYRAEARCPHAHFEYWIEGSLLAYYRRALIVLLDAADHYPEEKEEDDELTSATKAALKETRFRSFRDIVSLLDDASLKSLLGRLAKERSGGPLMLN